MEDDTNLSEQKHTKKKVLVFLAIILLLLISSLLGWTWHRQIQEYKNNIVLRDQQIDELKRKISRTSADDLGGVMKSLVVKDSKRSFTLQYPESWTGSVEELKPEGLPNGWVAQSAAITSPSGEVIIKLSTGISGIGGACIPQESGTITSLHVVGLTSMPSYSLVYYAFTSLNDDIPFYEAAVIANTDIQKAQVGGSVCDLAFSSFLDYGDTGAASFKITSKTIDGQDDTAAVANQRTQIETFFTSSEFQEAIKILKTLSSD